MTSSTGRSAVAGWVSSRSSRSGLSMQGSRGVEDQGVHRGCEDRLRRVRQAPSSEASRPTARIRRPERHSRRTGKPPRDTRAARDAPQRLRQPGRTGERRRRGSALCITCWLDPQTASVSRRSGRSSQFWQDAGQGWGPRQGGKAARRARPAPGQPARSASADSRVRNERQSGYSTSQSRGNRSATAPAR